MLNIKDHKVVMNFPSGQTTVTRRQKRIESQRSMIDRLDKFSLLSVQDVKMNAEQKQREKTSEGRETSSFLLLRPASSLTL